MTRQDEILGQAQDDSLWGLARGCAVVWGWRTEEMLKRIQHDGLWVGMGVNCEWYEGMGS